MSKGDNFTCVCRGEGGTGAINVTWYKENTQITETKKEEKILVLENVGESDTGIYKCVAQSHDQTDEKSIDVVVPRKYMTDILTNDEWFVFRTTNSV